MSKIETNHGCIIIIIPEDVVMTNGLDAFHRCVNRLTDESPPQVISHNGLKPQAQKPNEIVANFPNKKLNFISTALTFLLCSS